VVKILKEIGKLLKEKRLDNGVSIAEAAEDLEIDESALENMEEGNTRAFKDMYVLKELIKDYSKYLGLDVNDIVEEFNDFLFEHTSKISLEEIKEAKAKLQETAERKVVSPYTKIPKPKRDYQKIFRPILVLLLFIFILVLLFMLSKQEEKRSIELQNLFEEEVYEFA